MSVTINEEIKKAGVERSPHWPLAEKRHLLKHPYCEACGPTMDKNIKVQVHHVIPFHYVIALGRPELELDDRNLITLCEDEKGHPADNHHLLLGHAGNFKEANLDVRKDVASMQGQTAQAIKESTRYKEIEAGKLKPLDQMTDADKQGLINLMNTLYP